MSDLCKKHKEGYEPLRLGILTPMCPLCLQDENRRQTDLLVLAKEQMDAQAAENKQLKSSLDHIATCLSILRNEKDIKEIPRLVGILEDYTEQVLQETQ